MENVCKGLEHWLVILGQNCLLQKKEGERVEGKHAEQGSYFTSLNEHVMFSLECLTDRQAQIFQGPWLLFKLRQGHKWLQKVHKLTAYVNLSFSGSTLTQSHAIPRFVFPVEWNDGKGL